MLLDGKDGRPEIYNRYGSCVTLAELRAAIMRELRLVASVYSVAQRKAAVHNVTTDQRWLRSCSGQYLGATARDGFSECFKYLPAGTAP